MRRVLGVVLILMAVTLAVAPIFTDCQSQGKDLALADGRKVAMKCHWAGVAEVGVAVPMALAGLYVLGNRRKETTRLAALVGAASGAMALLLPTTLIGVCANPMMYCNLVMKPILLTGGILAIVASLVLYLTAREPEMPAAPSAA